MAADGHFVPAPGTRQRRSTAPAGPGARLPWWALLLPALAFSALLAVTAAGGQVGAAAGLLGHVRDVLPHALTAAR
jgi:hypothetical protein